MESQDTHPKAVRLALIEHVGHCRSVGTVKVIGSIHKKQKKPFKVFIHYYPNDLCERISRILKALT